MSQKPNIYELLEMRKKIKEYNKTGVEELKQILIQLKKMELDVETLYDTELPRTLVWVYNKLKDTPQDDPMKDIFKMVKFLYTKEWKPKFEKYLKKGDEGDEGKEQGKKQE